MPYSSVTREGYYPSFFAPAPVPEPEPAQARCHACRTHINEDDEDSYVIVRDHTHLDIQRHLCSGCYDDGDSHITCVVCGDDVLEGLSIAYNGGRACRRCRLLHGIHYCTDCEETYMGDHMASNNLCRSCAEENYFYCEGCDDYVDNDSYAGDDLCHSCWEDRRSSASAWLHDYDYRPWPWTFHGNRGPYYGVELETDDYEDAYSAGEELYSLAIRSNHKQFFLKEDGSLENGIEIVFHPRNLRNWESYDLAPIIRAVRNNGGKSFNYNTCGVHVHRSRNDLSDMDILKLNTFFSNNVDRICKVAQRRNDGYARFIFDGEDKNMIFKRMKRAHHVCERYSAINYTNDDTIEFRIFKGTLKISTIKAYVAWCHYLVEYVKKCLLNSLSWDGFCQFISIKSRKESQAANLVKYMTAKGAGFICA